MMRIRLLAVIAAGWLSASCADSPVQVEYGQLDPIASWLRSEGYDPDGYVVAGTEVIVEGDMSVALPSSLQTSVPGIDVSNVPILNQYFDAWADRVDPDEVNSISVNIAEISHDTANVIAAQAAIAAWNAIPGSFVRFTIVTGAADIDVFYGATQGGRVAEAQSVSSYGAIGDFIRVDSSIFAGYTTSKKTFTIAHELGHTVGVRHTNPFTNDCAGLSKTACANSGVLHVPFSPTCYGSESCDNSSVFMNTVADWGGFTTWDKAMIAQIFPLPTLDSAVGSYNGSGNPVFNWSPHAFATQYRVRMRAEYHWVTPYGSWVNESDWGALTTTTDTTYTELSRTYSGESGCYFNYPEAEEEVWVSYYFVVEAVFPTGSTLTQIVGGSEVFSCADINYP